MAAGRIVISEFAPARDRNDALVAGAKMYVYTNGTTTLASIYTSAALTTALANPVVANSSGQFAQVWADATLTYTVSITGPNGESIGNPSVFDDYSPSTNFAVMDVEEYKAPVRVASTANITIASALINGSTIDGVTVATGDRVLLKDQSTGSQNGIYVVVASGAASRSGDADISADVTSGMTMFVSEGTANGGATFTLTTANTITLGTTALTFSRYSGILPVVNGGTGSDTEAGARTNLAVVGTAELAASTGAALVGSIQSGTSAEARTVQAKQRDILDVRDFGVVGTGDEGAKIQAALTEAGSSGKELVWPGGSYSTSVALLVGAVKIRFTGPVTLTYTGSHAEYVLAIVCAGVAASIIGWLVIDADSKANMGVMITNNSATRVDLQLGDIEARNCRMLSGNAFNAGAGGVTIRGNFDQVLFDRLYAKTVSRAAGTGSISNFGSLGVEIGRTGGYAARRVVGRFIGAETVTTDDAPGVAACVDCDGVSIFQNDEEGASCTVEIASVLNGQGRGLKGQLYRTARFGQVRINRSIEGITGGSAEIDLQYGEGCVEQVDIRYSGNADLVHIRGTTCVSGGTSENRTDGYAVFEAANITVRDATTGTATINQVLALANGSASTANLLHSVRNVTLIGRAAANLVNIGQNGSSSTGNYLLSINGFIGSLSNSLIVCNGSPPKLRAHVSAVWNTGSEIPAIKRSDAVSLGNTFGRLHDGGGNIGVKRQTGSTDTPGLFNEAITLGGFTNSSEVIGDSILFAGIIAAGTTTELPAFGAVSGSARFWAGSPDFGAVGEYTTPPSSNTITTVQSSSGTTVGSGGVDPGGADLNLWKSSTGTRLTLKNASGSGRYYVVKTLG